MRTEQEDTVVGGDDDFWKWWSHAITNHERERERERKRRRRKAAHLAAAADNYEMVAAA